MDSRKDFETIIDEIGGYFSNLADMGVKGFDCSGESLAAMEKWGTPENEQRTLDSLEAEMAGCMRCGLGKSRKNLVFGRGNPEARLVFVGEGPGAQEDIKGEPFVGRAGELLTKIIQAMKLTREEVYICNIVKCRPPENRAPLPEEIETCAPFLNEQIALIKPEFICALGSTAASSLLSIKAPISSLRGRFHDYKGIKLMPTYHPAYLLRNPDMKSRVWQDIKKIMSLWYRKSRSNSLRNSAPSPDEHLL